MYCTKLCNHIAVKRTAFESGLSNVKDEKIKEKGKYACLTYVGKETKFITELFKYADVKV
jgi:hypothetical protein